MTRDGIPLGYEVFPGNLHDSKTVRSTVEAIESRYGRADRVWVMDRGMVSDETLEWMRGGGRRYLVGLPKSELKKHAAELADAAGWKAVRGGVAVRYAVAGHGGDQVLLCRSDDRREKETAIQELFAGRIEEALGKLQRRCRASARLLSPDKIQRQIGRLLQRNQRAARCFEIRCEAAPGLPSGVLVEWRRDETEQSFREISHGCYALSTNVHDWTEEEVWRTYIQLTQVESAFRAHKPDQHSDSNHTSSPIQTRPQFRTKPDQCSGANQTTWFRA